MGFMDKVKDFVAPIEEEDDYQEAPQAEKVEEVEPQSRYERPKARTNATSLNSNTKMVLFEPRSFGEAEEVGQRLKEGRAVVVNLHKLDRDYAQRTIDFLTGVVYALDGKIQKIGQNVILTIGCEHFSFQRIRLAILFPPAIIPASSRHACSQSPSVCLSRACPAPSHPLCLTLSASISRSVPMSPLQQKQRIHQDALLLQVPS